jgi:hypothetical protein
MNRQDAKNAKKNHKAGFGLSWHFGGSIRRNKKPEAAKLPVLNFCR